MSLKDIGKLSEPIKLFNNFKGVDDFRFDDVVSFVDSLSDVNEANTLFKNIGATKESAEKVLKGTHFSKTLGNTVEAATEGAEAITNVQAATKGLASSTDEVTGMGLACVLVTVIYKAKAKS